VREADGPDGKQERGEDERSQVHGIGRPVGGRVRRDARLAGVVDGRAEHAAEEKGQWPADDGHRQDHLTEPLIGGHCRDRA